MRDLPTIKLQPCSGTDPSEWKVFFPFNNEAIRLELQNFGLHYDEAQRVNVLCLPPGGLEQLKGELMGKAFLHLPYELYKPSVSPPASPSPIEAPSHSPPQPGTEDVVRSQRAEGVEQQIFLHVPAHRKDWQAFVKTLPGACWRPI